MQHIYKVLLCVICIVFPRSVSAGLSGSVNFSYQRIFEVIPIHALKLGNDNVWTYINVDVGYNFIQKNKGIFLAFNKIHVLGNTYNDVGYPFPNTYTFDRITFAILGRQYIGNKRDMVRFAVEAGPSINFQEYTSLLYTKITKNKTSGGLMVGVDLFVPIKGFHFICRATGFWVARFEHIQGYGLGISIGVGLGG